MGKTWRIVIRILRWRVFWRVAWALFLWAMRARQAKRGKRGVIGRVAAWDRAVSKHVATAVVPVPGWLIQLGAHLGDLWLWTAISGALFWRVASKCWWRWALSLGNSALATLLFKRLFRRTRPATLRWLYGKHGDEYSFPSGHAARWGTIVVWMWDKPRYRPAALVAALWTGWSRVRLGIHTVGDVVAGFALGVVLTTLLRRLSNG